MVLGLDHGEALTSPVHHLAIRSLQLNVFSTNRIFGTFLVVFNILWLVGECSYGIFHNEFWIIIN